MASREKVTWIGNKATKEFHRVVVGKRHPAKCLFGQIVPENTVSFARAKDAREAGFDAAAHCTKKFKSHDNE